MLQDFGAQDQIKGLIWKRNHFAIVIYRLGIPVAELRRFRHVDPLIFGGAGIKQIAKGAVPTSDIQNSAGGRLQPLAQIKIDRVGLEISAQPEIE